MMKLPVLCLAVLSSTLAVPNGYYHQEYNYKTSSSSFKNNELQHKTDDQGYYKKDGDLEGHTKPRVDSNSEHSEYVNPNLRNSQYGNLGSQYTSGYGGGSDLTSLGHMRAANDYSGYDANNLAVDGLAHNDRIVGSRGYSSGYSSGYGSNSYGAGSSSSSSSSAANLRVITTRLQQDLENDLQEAIRVNNMYAQSRVDIAELERELRNNLTERLNNELIARYGQQMIRDGMSYSLDGGRLHSTANYGSQELADLKRQVENTLMNQLRTQYHSSSSSSNQYYNQQGVYGYTTTPHSVYRPIYPSLPTTSRYPIDYNNHANYQTIKSSNYQTVNSNTRYTPVQQPESITNIASRVQTEMDQQLNQLLDDTKAKYFSSSSAYALTNTDVLLERLRNELRSNLTYLLDENIRRNYGTQQQRDGYMYSLGPSGQSSGEYNYALRDLENLKTQVERNLINKLNRDFEGYRSSWSSHQSYSSQSSYGNNYGYSSTPRYESISNPRYEVYTTPRSSIYSLYTTPSSNGAAYIKNGGSYNYLGGSQQSGYEAQSSGNMAQLQRNLQDQLSRQLQAAINQEQHSSYSSSGSSYNPSNYQASLQELSNELNRNLTKNLQEYSASGSYAAYGNFDSTQMERLRSQLQDSLMSELRQGLQRSFQTHGSYSSSSSGSSNYRQVRGYQDQGQYRSGYESIAGEDCDGHQSYRAKRSYSPSSYAWSRHHSQSSHYSGAISSYPGNHYSSYGRRAESTNQQELGQQIELGQELENSDLVQEVQNPLEFGQQEEESYGKLQLSNQEPLGQHIDDSDLTQQVEDSGYGKLQLSNQEPLGQQIDDSDLTQQIEDSGYGKLQLSNQEPLGQQIDDSDLTQQVEDSGYGKLQLSNQKPLGQQIDDSDLTQQVEDSGHGKLQLSNQEPLGQQIDDSDLTQQIEDSGYGKLQLSNQEPLGQQIDDSDLTQQVEDSGHGKLQLSNQEPLGQQIDDSDLTQQVEDSGYGKLQLSNQEPLGQQIDDSDLTQQIEDSGYGKLLVHQNQSPLDVGQQIEEEHSGNGKLQLTNQEPLGQQIEDSELTQQVEEAHPIEFGQQVEDGESSTEKLLVQKIEQLELGQQVEKDDTKYGVPITDQIELEEPTEKYQQLEQHTIGKHDSVFTKHIEETHVPEPCLQVTSIIHLEEVTQIPILKKPEEQKINNSDAWCKKYVDSSLMDAPWSLSEELKNSIRKEVSQNGGNKAESAFVLKKIQQQIPEDMLRKCFQLNNIKNQKDQKILITGLEDYFQSLINREIETAGKGSNLEQESENLNQQQVVDDPDDLIDPILVIGRQNPYTRDEIIQSHDEQYTADKSYNLEQESKNLNQQQVVDVPDDLMDPILLAGRQNPYTQNEIIQSHEEQYNAGKGHNLEQENENLNQQQVVDVPDDLMDPILLAGRQNPYTQNEIIQSHEEQYNAGKGHNLEQENENLNQQQVVDVPDDLVEPKLLLGRQNPSTQNDIVQSHDEQFHVDLSTWCDKYVDTSLMDAPWFLGRELKDNITKEVAQNGGSKADLPYLTRKILDGIPKEMLTKCFQVDMTELKYQKTVLAGLDEYFNSLIKRHIENVVKGNTEDNGQQLDVESLIEPEPLRKDDGYQQPTYGAVGYQKPPHQIEIIQPQVLNSFENWCSQYVDLTLKDVPWGISKKLKDNINEKVKEGSSSETTYNKILAGVPKNMLRKCFQIDTIEANEQVTVLAGIEDYFQSLIRREIQSSIKRNKQQVVDISDNRQNILTNQQPSAQNSEQDQVAPQNIAEAERTADVLIDALRRESQHRQISEIQEIGGFGYRRRPPHASPYPQNGYSGHYNPARDSYTPYGNRNSYGLDNFDRFNDYHPGVGHHDRSHPAFDSYGNYHPRLETTNSYGPYYQIPRRPADSRADSYPYQQRQVVEQNMELNRGHRYSDIDSYGLYHQRPRVSSYSHSYGQKQVGTENVEPESNIEQLNGGNENYLPVKTQRRPVYSGIKGRRIPHPMMQEPVQEPIITPVSVAPSSKNSEIKPQKIIASEQVEGTTVSSPEELSWWQKFGNKVKQGAQSLKQKITG
ncbi:unnamed protein product [Phaedon cochleariae]|uniref:Uncharacterized protein n=1 Tax=Phaedon cochleariae TaxID=80249 RepID=A0A9N9SL20_PHACE|nr:unnamed protein product [Phaedon cochleariae]